MFSTKQKLVVLLLISFASYSTSVYSNFWNHVLQEETWKKVYSGILNLVPPDRIVGNRGSYSRPISTSYRPFEVPKCGRSKMDNITLTSPTKAGDWPWHTAMFREITAMGQSEYLCGGTLLSRNRVLTAAHCLRQEDEIISPDTLLVILGKHKFDGDDINSRKIRVYDVIFHPEFDANNLSNDIAVLKLASVVVFTDYIQPICLLETDFPKYTIINKRGIVLRWGINEDGKLTDLRKTTMQVVDDLTCIRSNPLFYTKYVSDNSFCARRSNNDNSVCKSDSGNGMYFSYTGEDGVETWFIRGIVSLVVSNVDHRCDPNTYVLFTDSAAYLNFIQRNL